MSTFHDPTPPVATNLEWTRTEVKPWVEENERGGSWHATFTLGIKSVTFIVVAMKRNGNDEPYTVAYWTAPNGDAVRSPERTAARVNGSVCTGVVIEMLGSGLRDGTVPAVSPNGGQS